MSGPMEGRCLCGAVTIRVAGPHDSQVGACHCRMCQRWSGGLFLSFEADADGVTVAGPVTRYASSSFAERAFCATCGTHLWVKDAGDPHYEFMPGLFDAAGVMPLRSEIYVDEAMASVQLGGRHARVTAADYQSSNPHVEGATP